MRLAQPPERKSPKMTCITKSIVGLPMTAMFLTAALAATALAGPAAAHQVPFKGSIQMFESVVVQFPTLFSDGQGSGEATHLGRFTVTRQAVVDIPTDVAVGSAHFTAANGDSVFTESVAQSDPTEDPDVLLVEETYTITGGTGRFAGASGSFKVERLFNLVTGFTSGSFDGFIVIEHD